MLLLTFSYHPNNGAGAELLRGMAIFIELQSLGEKGIRYSVFSIRYSVPMSFAIGIYLR